MQKETTMQECDFVVIGGGISGIYLTYLLKGLGFKPLLLEADNRLGGRIRQQICFDGFGAEAGAQEIHGNESVVYKIAEDQGFELMPENKTEYYYVEGELKTFLRSTQLDGFEKAVEFFKEIPRYEGEESTLLEKAKESAHFETYKNVQEGFASEYGTTMSRLGAKSLGIAEKNWSAGHKLYTLKEPYLNLFEGLLEQVSDVSLLGRKVTEIEMPEEGGALVKTSGGEVYKAKAAIVTVPLGVLKAECIRFSPPLPPEKKSAIENIGFGPGMKFWIEFNTRIWPENLMYLYGGSYCPIYYPSKSNTEKEAWVITAYLMGEKAEAVQRLGGMAHLALLEELDGMLGDNLASKNYKRHDFYDWSENPLIRGTYSFASPYSTEKRVQLAANIEGKIFFAGEATHLYGHHGTVTGAIETAYEAAYEIAEYFEPINKDFKL